MRGTLGSASAWIATVVFAAAAAAADAPGAPFTLISPDIAPGGKIANAQVYNGFGSAARVAFNVHAQALGSAALTGIYGR